MFVSNRDGQTGVWRMNVDGSDPRLLAHLPRPSWLSVTPDGQFVVCASLGDAEPATWRVPIDGGKPTLIAAGIDRPAVSPDGRFLAGINVASTPDNSRSSPCRSMAADRRACSAPSRRRRRTACRVDGERRRHPLFDRRAGERLAAALSGGPPVKVTNLTDLGIVRGKRTADGDALIVARGVAQTDAYLVSNFQ